MHYFCIILIINLLITYVRLLSFYYEEFVNLLSRFKFCYK